MANHQSTLDNAVLSMLTDASPTGEKKYLTKKAYYLLPIFGWMQYLSGDIAVDVSSPESRKKALADCKRALEEGSSIVIYPEGTRNKHVRERGLVEFKSGAFRTARDCGVRVLPVCIWGTLDGMGSACSCDGLLSVAPAHLVCSIGPPIVAPTGSDDEAKLEYMKKEAREWIDREYRAIVAEFGRPVQGEAETTALTTGTRADYGGSK